MALAVGVVLVAGVGVIVPRWAAGRDRVRAAELYEARCVVCHDVEGGIGTRLDRRVLASYKTARGLFNYVRLAMPYDAPRTLPDEEYWLAVGHLLRSRGLVGEDVVVNAATADGIELEGDG